MKTKYLLIIAAIVLLIVGSVYGYKQYKFYVEKKQIVEAQQKWTEELEKADVEHNKTEDELYAKLRQKEAEIKQKDLEINNLETQIHNIIVPGDSAGLVDAWSKVGIRASRRIVK